MPFSLIRPKKMLTLLNLLPMPLLKPLKKPPLLPRLLQIQQMQLMIRKLPLQLPSKQLLTLRPQQKKPPLTQPTLMLTQPPPPLPRPMPIKQKQKQRKQLTKQKQLPTKPQKQPPKLL
jgi:hypothetical protein